MRTERDAQRIMIMGAEDSIGGVVSAIGNDVPTFWRALVEGRGGIDFLPEEMRTMGVVCGVLVRNHRGDEFFHPADLDDIHPVVQYANTVKIQALRSAEFLNGDLSLKDVDPKKIGIFVGTGTGGTFHSGYMQAELNSGKHLSAHDLFQAISCRTSLTLTMQEIQQPGTEGQDIEGPAVTIHNACASSGVAATLAADAIKLGRIDAAVVIGAEKWVGKLGIEAFLPLGVLSRSSVPRFACRPFSREGAVGFVPGDGAGALVFESLEHVKRRNALHLVRGELLGYMNLSDGFCRDSEEDNIEMGLGVRYRRNANVAPSLIGAINVTVGALKHAGKSPEEIKYISAHNAGTKVGGIVESKAIERVFGSRCIPISAGKEYYGHTIGGDFMRLNGVMMSLQTGIIPQILTLEKPIADLGFVMGGARRYEPGEIDTAVFYQFGFGGGNVCLVIGRFDSA